MSKEFARRFVFAFLVTFVVLGGVFKNQPFGSTKGISKDTSRFEVINFSIERKQLIARNSADGRAIASSLYGPYAPLILNSEIALSPKELGEFTIPIVEVGGQLLGVVENPRMRMWLWEMHDPDVVLLGSSMLFMNFSRAYFFSRFPGKRLIDFTMGDNNPAIAEYLLDQAEARGLKIPQGATFIYGLNQFELFPTYHSDPKFYQHVFNAYERKADSGRLRFHEAMDDYFNIPEFRLLLAEKLSEVLDRLGLKRSYLRRVPGEIAQDGSKLQLYFMSKNVESKELARVTVPKPLISSSRIETLVRIANRLKNAGARLIIVRLPDSTMDMNLTQEFYASANEGAKILAEKSFEIIDARDHKLVGIDDADYVYPNRVFNPQHMNASGGRRFTEFLIRRIFTVSGESAK